MDLSSLEICQRGIRNLPNVSTVSDVQPTSLAQEQLGDSPWLIFGRKLQGMTTETLLGPRATSLTQPVPEQARPKQLFGMSPTALPWPKPPASSSLFFPYCLWCHQPFLSSWSLFLLHSSYEHDHQLIFLPTSPIASSALHFYYFFFPNPFFSATPTQFFSWLPPPLAYSTFQSLMTLNNHLYELRAFVPGAASREAAAAAAITWPYGGLLPRQWNHRNVFRQDHCLGILVIFLQIELHGNIFFTSILKSSISFLSLLRHCSF